MNKLTIKKAFLASFPAEFLAPFPAEFLAPFLVNLPQLYEAGCPRSALPLRVVSAAGDRNIFVLTKNILLEISLASWRNGAQMQFGKNTPPKMFLLVVDKQYHKDNHTLFRR